MRFGDLKAGDVVHLMGVRSVVLAVEKPHPQNRAFWLVVWFIFGENRLSFDMLDPRYDLISGTTVSDDGLRSFEQALHLTGELR